MKTNPVLHKFLWIFSSFGYFFLTFLPIIFVKRNEFTPLYLETQLSACAMFKQIS